MNNSAVCRVPASLRYEDLSQRVSFDPIAGLEELLNIRVWFPTVMLDERGHGGEVQVE